MMRDDSEFDDTLHRFEAIVDEFSFLMGSNCYRRCTMSSRILRTPSVDEVVQAIGSWSARKADASRKADLFRAPQATAAYRHLVGVRVVEPVVGV
jgi:hypothetical protein